MALKTFVKISSITNLSDARYCAGMMVDVLGFNIDQTSQECISKEEFTEITEWVAGVQFAGEFHSANADQIKDALKDFPIDYIEIANLELVEKVQLLGKPIIFRLTINDEHDLDSLKSNLSYLDELASFVIIKSNNPMLHDQIDAQIGYYNGNLTLLKGYGIQPSPIIHKFPGLEMEATKEDRPGFKDYGEIMDVLELLEEE